MSELIGRLQPYPKEVTLVGGGISGLLLAYALNERGYGVHLIEAQSRWGGLIQTFELPQGKAESAAHSLLVTPEVRSLFEQLGVPLVDLNPDSKARYILRNGRWRRFPLTLSETLELIFRITFKKALSTPEYQKGSVHLWAEHHLGKAAVKYLFAPMLQGIYGAQPSEISLRAAFPSLCIPEGQSLLRHLLSQALRKKPLNSVRSRSFIQAQEQSQSCSLTQAEETSPISTEKSSFRKAIMTPRDGMESLVHALVKKLESDPRNRLTLSKKLTELPEVPNLILALPAFEASHLLREAAPELSQALSQIQYTPLISVTLFIPQAQLKRVPHGLGILIPQEENRHCLGILFNSSSFPNKVKKPDDWISCTAFLGGSRNPEFLKESDLSIIARIEEDLNSLFGWEGHLSEYSISRWNRAIPKYNESLIEAWATARKTWCAQEGRILFGNYTGEVSLRGMIETCSKISF